MTCLGRRQIFLVLVTSAAVIVVISTHFLLHDNFSFRSLTNQTISTNSYTPSYLYNSNESNRFPYFFGPMSSHPNDIFRKHVNYSFGRLKLQDSHQSKLILFFNTPGWIKPYFQDSCSRGIELCPINSCQCTNDTEDLSRASAVIFDAVELRYETPPTKHFNQVWIFYGIEPPTSYVSQRFRKPQWRPMFNWTMTYRLDSDIMAPYDVVIRKREMLKTNYTHIALSKSKSAVWLVSHCETQSKRELYVRELRKHYDVDIYGRCGPQQDIVEGDFYSKYRFYLSFENALCDDYMSEKSFKIYKRDIFLVPIVRFAAESAILLPAGTYIDTAKFSSPKALADYLKYLERNVTAYAEILREKDKYTAVGRLGKLSSPFCDICVKLHNLEIFSNHYSDTAEWLERDTCHEPDDF